MAGWRGWRNAKGLNLVGTASSEMRSPVARQPRARGHQATADSNGEGARRRPNRSPSGGGTGSRGEEAFAFQVRAFHLVGAEREYRFDPARRWRFDFAWPGLMLAVEIEGGIWSGGRHTRGAGYQGDMEKYNRAAALGWTVLRFTPAQVTTGEALAQVSATIQERQKCKELT